MFLRFLRCIVWYYGLNQLKIDIQVKKCASQLHCPNIHIWRECFQIPLWPVTQCCKITKYLLIKEMFFFILFKKLNWRRGWTRPWRWPNGASHSFIATDDHSSTHLQLPQQLRAALRAPALARVCLDRQHVARREGRSRQQARPVARQPLPPAYKLQGTLYRR